MKVEEFVKKFTPPKGFTKELSIKEWSPNDKMKLLTIKNADDSICFEVYFNEEKDEDSGAFSYSGHTHFNLADGSRVTFDRTGVLDSFYGSERANLKDKGKYDLPLEEELLRQLKMINESQERSKRTVHLPPPLGNWRRTTEEIEELKKNLKKFGVITFTPPGFGTGYRISARRSRYCRPAPELAKLFGVPALYAEEMDCD